MGFEDSVRGLSAYAAWRYSSMRPPRIGDGRPGMPGGQHYEDEYRHPGTRHANKSHELLTPRASQWRKFSPLRLKPSKGAVG